MVELAQGVSVSVGVGVSVSCGVSVKVRVNPVGDGPAVSVGTRV